MNVFEILTEARIREWERGKREGTVPAESEPGHGGGESFDEQLLRQIVDLLGETVPAGREKARDLEIQLMASLEKRGLNLTAKRIADELDAIRKRESN